MSTWSPEKIHLNVKTDKKLITIEVDQNERVSNLKSILASIQSIPAKSQLLIYGNQKLEDNKTLRLYNIKHQSTVYLTEKLNVNDTEYREMNIETVDNSFISDDEDDRLRMQQSKNSNNNKQASFTKLSYTKNKVKSKPSWRYFYKVTNPELNTMIYNKLKLYIKLPSEKTIALYVDQNYKIYEIKDMVSQIENIPADKQILKIANKELLNYETLKEYNIQTNARLTLDLKENEKSNKSEKFENEYVIVESKDIDDNHYNKNGNNEGFVYRAEPDYEQTQHSNHNQKQQYQTQEPPHQNQKQQQQKNQQKEQKKSKKR